MKQSGCECNLLKGLPHTLCELCRLLTEQVFVKGLSRRDTVRVHVGGIFPKPGDIIGGQSHGGGVYVLKEVIGCEDFEHQDGRLSVILTYKVWLI